MGWQLQQAVATPPSNGLVLGLCHRSVRSHAPPPQLSRPDIASPITAQQSRDALRIGDLPFASDLFRCSSNQSCPAGGSHESPQLAVALRRFSHNPHGQAQRTRSLIKPLRRCHAKPNATGRGTRRSMDNSVSTQRNYSSRSTRLPLRP